MGGCLCYWVGFLSSFFALSASVLHTCHVFSRDIFPRDLFVPPSLHYRYQYDSSKLQELISELDRVSFKINTGKKSKREKVGTWTPKITCMELIHDVSFEEKRELDSKPINLCFLY